MLRKMCAPYFLRREKEGILRDGDKDKDGGEKNKEEQRNWWRQHGHPPETRQRKWAKRTTKSLGFHSQKRRKLYTQGIFTISNDPKSVE